MSTKEEVKLKNEQEVPMFEYNSAVQELIKIAKQQKEDLDHKIVLATNNLKLLQEEHIRRQGEFNQWRMAEEQKFRNEVSKRHNQLIEQENRMNMLHRDLEQRGADLLVKEERFLKLDEERNKIGNERVEIEKMRVNAFNSMSEADRKISEANSNMAQANVRIEQSINLDNKNSIRNQELCFREDKLAEDLKKLELEKNHLMELKNFVEPKIKEIQELEAQISENKKDIDLKHEDIINKTEENKIALRALEDKKIAHDARERELRSREDELKRKIIIQDMKK